MKMRDLLAVSIALLVGLSGSALVCLFNSLNRARCVVNRLSSQLQTKTWIVHGGHL